MLKKIIVIICSILLFFLLYFLQSNVFSWFHIAGIKPNLFIILILYMGLFIGKGFGFTMGATWGILLDILSGRIIGINGIMLGIIGWLGGYLDKKFSKDSKLTIILMIVGATILFELGICILQGMFLGSSISIPYFLRTIIIESIYNIILFIIFYPILKKLGYYVQDVFKGNHILTRYF